VVEPCAGKKLKHEALSVTLAGPDIGELSQPLPDQSRPVAGG
jgi:excinuclease UvrABC ATPase subunit